MTTFTTVLNLVKVPIGAVLFGVFGALDLWHFKTLPVTTDFGVIVGAAAALGISGSYSAGQASAVIRANAEQSHP